MSNFKTGDKIRIKDEVSSKTHRKMSPHFTEDMDRLKDKILTIRGFTYLGYIKVENSGFSIHPEWVTLAESGNFKTGDKIRIKDEVSSETHRYMPPHFIGSMDRFKDEVLTIKGFTSLGNIEVEDYMFCLHPEWVTLAESDKRSEGDRLEAAKDDFKEGDKIRIKDEVSHLTHRKQFPHFIEEMAKMKDKVLTIKGFTNLGCIKVENFRFSLHPEWVTLAESEPEDDFGSAFAEIIKQLSEELSGYDSASILEEAQEILGGERESDYGDPVANFNRISGIASSILNETITPEQCVVVMMAVKLSREQYKHKRDNLVDLVAYTEIYNRVKEQNN